MKAETKVGLLFLGTLILVIGFAYTLGVFNLFGNTNTINITYNYAGGIEEGSAVRVMGIKVGKVQSIRFDPTMKDAQGNEVKLVITITVEKKAWNSVKSDSQFFINLAGVIGEKFVEISPGSAELPELEPGVTLRGEDPPRIDQLISQSYGLAGKVLELVEKNEGSFTNTIHMLNDLVTNVNKLVPNLNKLLGQVEKTTKNAKIASLLNNMEQISGDIAAVSGRLRSEKTGETIDLVHELIWRLDDLDKNAIKKFLQEEGIRAKLF